ncbi:hypothetical protein GCM10010340_68510 [Streptomyces griseoloalbus]|nr:hypothetical protein GCM10010340_68510 [Streptomyces albaduncus]
METDGEQAWCGPSGRACDWACGWAVAGPAAVSQAAGRREGRGGGGEEGSQAHARTVGRPGDGLSPRTDT